MTEFVNVFAASYEVHDDPSCPAGGNSYDFVAAGVSELSPAVEITVTLTTGSTWHGRFFGNYDSPSVVVNGPGLDTLVVVAAGVVYVVRVASPSDFHVLATWPVRFIHCVPLLGLVLLADFTDIVALGDGGTVRWEAKDLVSDGFTKLIVSGSAFVAGGYVAPEGRDVETILDVATGTILDRK